MAARKSKIELIKDLKTRYYVFQKRRKSLLKKALELSTLCNVPLCVVVFPPKETRQQAKIETWPSSVEDVKKIIATYMSSKHPIIYTISNYFELKNKKGCSQFTTQNTENCESRKDLLWDKRLDDFSKHELAKLLSCLEVKIEVANLKLNKYSVKEASRCDRLKDVETISTYDHPSNTSNMNGKFACDFSRWIMHGRQDANEVPLLTNHNQHREKENVFMTKYYNMHESNLLGCQWPNNMQNPQSFNSVGDYPPYHDFCGSKDTLNTRNSPMMQYAINCQLSFDSQLCFAADPFNEQQHTHMISSLQGLPHYVLMQ